MLNKFTISTDAVYKYLVTLGSVLFLASMGALSLGNTTLMEKKLSYQLKYAELAGGGASEGILKNYSDGVEIYFAELENSISIVDGFSIFGLFLSSAMIIVGIAIWLGRQDNENMLLKLQVDEAELRNKILEKELHAD